MGSKEWGDCNTMKKNIKEALMIYGGGFILIFIFYMWFMTNELGESVFDSIGWSLLVAFFGVLIAFAFAGGFSLLE